MQVMKQQLELDKEQWTNLKLGKEYVKAVYYYTAYLTSMHSTSCEMPDCMKHKLESRLPGETSTTSERVKEESEKAGLKLNIQKAKIMASGSITSWQINGETVASVGDFIFLGSKITEDGDCSHEIKRRLLLGRKVVTNLDNIFKSRDITLPTKVRLINAMALWSCMDVRVRL